MGRAQLNRFKDVHTEICSKQGQNLALTVFCVPNLPDNDFEEACSWVRNVGVGIGMTGSVVFRVSGMDFKCMVLDLGLRVKGLRFGVQDLRVQGLGFAV